MMNIRILFSSFFVLLAFGCRKNLPQIPDATTPVFFIEVNSPELSLHVQAGVDDVLFDVDQEKRFGATILRSFLSSNDINIQASFYADEIFETFDIEDLLALTNLGLAYQGSSNLAELDTSNLPFSDFDELNFILNNVNSGTNLSIHEPGIQRVNVFSSLNGITTELENDVVFGFDNPYKFKIETTIITGGPTDILQGSISENSLPIESIEWQTGSNNQTTIGQNNVQFAPLGSANKLSAIVHFQDGTVRTRELSFGFQNAPKIEDYVFLLESNSSTNFSRRIDFEFHLDDATWSSRYVTEFPQGSPNLNVIEIAAYTEPITKRNIRLIKANGLVYFKNQDTQVTAACQVSLNLGFEFE